MRVPWPGSIRSFSRKASTSRICVHSWRHGIGISLAVVAHDLVPASVNELRWKTCSGQEVDQMVAESARDDRCNDRHASRY